MAVNYQRVPHLIDRQREGEEALLRELEQGNYTHTSPLVRRDPYLINPLSALICFDTQEERAVTVTVRGKVRPQGDITHTFPPARRHILPVVGLYAGWKNEVEVRLYQGETTVVEVETPDLFPQGEPLISMDTTAEYLGDRLITLGYAWMKNPIGFDYRGDVRWYLSVPCIFDMKRSHNGHLLIGTDRLLQEPYYVSGLYEMGLIGKIYREFRLPGGYHHDDFEMPDGDLLVLTEDLRSETVEDLVVLVDRQTGAVKRTWDLKEVMPVGWGRSGSWEEADWFHANALWYDPATGSITISGRHVSAIVNLDFDTGALNWVLTDPAVFTQAGKERYGWPREFVDKYCLKPVGNSFTWQYEQHSVVVAPDGDILCFDNHHWGDRDPDRYAQPKDSFSRAVRYRVDPVKRTVEQVWSWGADRGAAFFSPYISNVEYYGPGWYMVHSGGIVYAADGEPSHLLGPGTERAGGRLEAITVELKNGKPQLELRTADNFYRAEKLSPYAPGDELVLGPGRVLGEMGVTGETAPEGPLTPAGEVPGEYGASLTEEDDRFVFTLDLPTHQTAYLLLTGEGEHSYLVARPPEIKEGGEVPPPSRRVALSVNKAGLRGEYALTLAVDGLAYDAGVTVRC